MSSPLEIVRQITKQFCLDSVKHPYLCYTEHRLHALLFTQLYNALPDDQRYELWDGHEVCLIQKEYLTAHDLDKSKRQHWDLAVIKTPPESLPEGDHPAYDSLRLAAAIEAGLNEPAAHLREDIRRLSHEKANLEQGLVLHLYRLAEPGKRVSGRDWSYNSPRIVTVEQAKEILEEQAAKAAGDQEVEILYAVAGEAGKHERGVWLIRRGETTRLA